MDPLIVKSLHIIFVVTWFAGLFYIWRLFVYHAEAASKPEPERSILTKQYGLMERRLWYVITWPSCVLTMIFGTWLLVQNMSFLADAWMQVKLFFIAVLLAYQFYGQKVYRILQTQPDRYNSFYFRLLNEVGTVLLIAIVFLVVNKTSISWIWGVLGLIGIGIIITLVAKMYKKKRERNEGGTPS
ncbi:MAG: CopD family protein [Crocinitomicaceae bacterium]|nr:CopD family protein [Crocinitomicaceae bacterium]